MEEGITTPETTVSSVKTGVDIREVSARIDKPAPETQDSRDFLELVRQRNAARYAQQEAPKVEEKPVDNGEEINLLRPSLLDEKYEVPGVPEVQIEDTEEKTEEVAEEVQENPVEPKRNTKAENLKNLRIALKGSRDRVAELESELENKNKELEKLSEIDELKTQLQEKEERLQKLKQYEDVVSLYGTEGFKEKFYDSVDALKKQAIDIANDYGVRGDVIEAALRITNQRQLNDYLSRYFDTFAVQDIRGIVKEVQQIVSDRQEAEAAPEKAREMLLTTVAKRREAERLQARQNLNTVGTDAWNEMAAAYSNKESGVSLLQEKDGNKGHNSIRQAILQGASKEYGKTLAILAENGLREIPPTVARAMASRYQLGEAAAHAIVQAENLYKENVELKKELKKFTEYERPLSSGKTVSGVNNTETKLTGRELARYIYDKAASRLS